MRNILWKLVLGKPSDEIFIVTEITENYGVRLYSLYGDNNIMMEQISDDKYNRKDYIRNVQIIRDSQKK